MALKRSSRRHSCCLDVIPFTMLMYRERISPAILSGRGLASMRYRFGQSNLCYFHPFKKK
ncbi:hypothetical protein NC652_014201 [Populus alba x Populus x berolinensis]|nr:hypothetical protein NC652_014201 [Populus alba x Populus x berolinensis]